jgi:hypothetical protein
MRYLFGLLCVCALGLMPLFGCGEEERESECLTHEECDDGDTCTVDYCSGASSDGTRPGRCQDSPISCQLTFPPLPEWLGGYHRDCVSAELDVCDPEAPEDLACGAITIIDGVSCSGPTYIISYCLWGRFECLGGRCRCVV